MLKNFHSLLPINTKKNKKLIPDGYENLIKPIV